MRLTEKPLPAIEMVFYININYLYLMQSIDSRHGLLLQLTLRGDMSPSGPAMNHLET
jgi:hypothetical protein